MEPNLVEQFERDGFVPGPLVLEGDELAEARRAVDRIMAGTCARASDLLLFRRERRDDPTSQVHVIGLWLAEDALRRLAYHPVIVRSVCQLMHSDRVRLFRDQLFFKAPFSTGAVPWHQDYSDWTHTTPPRHITCWMALDEATVENGCLYYVPGTYAGSLLPKIDRTDTMASAFDRLPAELRADLHPVPVPVRAGGSVFHHCLTIHGSYGNTTPAGRRAIAITYMHPETKSASGQKPVVPKGPAFAEGSLLEGALFPLLQAG